MKTRLDQELVRLGLVSTRSQAESYIKLGLVRVNGKVITKPGHLAGEADKITLLAKEQYVSRAALKLASVAESFNLDFRGKVVLDVGSSTGGFTDYALRHGARKVIAVDVGTNQMHLKLRTDPRVELHEKTDIRDVRLHRTVDSSENRREVSKTMADSHTPRFLLITSAPDIVLVDVSFISLREFLPHVSKLMARDSILVAMAKPQFETGAGNLKHKGVIKNDKIRRNILKSLENWIHNLFIIVNKADSEVPGEKGNTERFYFLKKPAARNLENSD